MFSDKQELALQLIREGHNLFITGGGGVGKSYTVNQIHDPNTVLAGPTGISALNINGSTCHRLFGLPIGLPTPKDFMNVSRKVQELFGQGSPVKRIVLDEFSMIRLDMLELINSKLQMARGNNKPFGGIQIVAVGDYYQLDPIVSGQERKIFFDQYPSAFNFKSEIFDFKIVELDKVFRQEDERQVKMLNSIRRKDKYYKLALDTIVKESKPYVPSPDVTVICCYKADARKYNHKYFNLLKTPVYEFNARITGDDKWKESVVAHTVKLREGCRVIFKANDQYDSFVNGEKGVVTYVDNALVQVQKDNGDIVSVYPNVWEKYEYKNKTGMLEKEIISTFTQIPLDLAYAQSVHSSQGLTMEGCAIDVGKGCFSHGQFYVALSRAKDLREVSFTRPPSYSDVICHKDVKEFYRNLNK